MSNNLVITNLLKLSNTKIDAPRMREILTDNKKSLMEDNFLDKLYKFGKLSQNEIERVKKINIDKQLQIVKSKEISLFTFEDADYPENLKKLGDSPPILYCKGKLSPEDNNAVAIVGTRRATEYGKTVARNLAKELSCRGVTIISGLARGIDTQAHLGALEKNGRTIAVMGTGIDRIYPTGNRNLASRIIKNGALVTELPPFSPPLPYHFPSRNRIISGLSRAVIAIEAPLKSGVLSTVKWALEYGRDVYALPADITSEVSKGTNRLLKMGAIPITGYQDILNNTGLDIKEKEIQKLDKLEHIPENVRKVYELLELKPKTVDILAYEAKMKPQEILSLMLILEMKGLAREIGGKRFIRENL